MVEDGEDCTDNKQPELEQLIQDVKLASVFRGKTDKSATFELGGEKATHY